MTSKIREAIDNGRLPFGDNPDGSRSLWANEEAFKSHVASTIRNNIDATISSLKKCKRNDGKMSKEDFDNIMTHLDFLEYLNELDWNKDEPIVTL